MSAPLLRIPGPAATDLPPGVALETILADLADDQVSVPDSADSELDPSQLVEQVQRAQDHGIDLSVVVVDSNPYMDSQLRDLATAVGSEDGGTVLVLSPNWVGTFSDALDRVTLEAAQDRTYTGDPVESTTNFVDSLLEPSPPWTAMTLVLILLVAAAGGLTYLAKIRRAHAESEAGSATGQVSPERDSSSR
ncbi:MULTISPECIES: Rv1476 family membrane protein [unclassified Rhodococcus (in: high G+C Gram-positive bacteria)]|uniref:Rv1476 family membrane protein n=1 Tax=Rhodococcus sp. SJ-3 TaxID=3454628 RepID=UPI002D9A7153|nr:DUF6676 family protein [Rhodococcus sp. (in: high G+C Gram-positive bacteria)]